MINNQNRPHLGLPAEGPAAHVNDRAVHALQGQAGMATALLRSITDRPRSYSSAERRDFSSRNADLHRDIGAAVSSAQRLLSSPALTPRAAGDIARAMSMLHKASAEEVRVHGTHASVVPRSLRQDLAQVVKTYMQRATGAQAPQPDPKLKRSGKQFNLRAQAAARPQAPAQQDSLATLNGPPEGGHEPLARHRGARGPEPQAAKTGPKELRKPWQKLAAKLGLASRKLVGKTVSNQPLITAFIMEAPRAQEAPQQVKVKRSYHEYANMPFASGSSKQRFSRITAGSGREYVMTWTQNRGGYGKLRWGFTPSGQDVAIKEIRHRYKPGYNLRGQPKTHAVDRQTAVDEANQNVTLRRKIEGYTKYWDTLPINEPSSLKSFRSGVKQYVLHDVVVDDTSPDGKTYIVMSRETGDLLQLRKKLGGANSGAAALSLAAQGFTELTGMHEAAHHMHGDLRLENVFFNGKGQMKLMDFGLATPIDKQGRGTMQHLYGSTTAPEAVAFGPGNENYPRLSAATDVYAMGVVVAEMAHHPDAGIVNPFHTGFLMPGFSDQQAYPSYQTMFSLFEQWKGSITGPNGRVDVRRINGNSASLFDRFFADLARENPALCDMVINEAMATKITDRPPARALATRARAMGATKGAGLMQLQQSMAQMEAQSDASKFRDNALAYDKFDKDETAKTAQRMTGRKKFRDLNI